MLTLNPPAIYLLIASLLISGCSLFSRGTYDRTPGTKIDDTFINTIAAREINKSDPLFKASNINIVSFNGLVLLTGQIQDEQLSRKAERIVQKIRKVRKVVNFLEVGVPISYIARTNDTWLTSKVIAQLLLEKNIDNDDYKVVTENGVVYLMGNVTISDSIAIQEVAQNVFGVQKVIKVFDYID